MKHYVADNKLKFYLPNDPTSNNARIMTAIRDTFALYNWQPVNQIIMQHEIYRVSVEHGINIRSKLAGVVEKGYIHYAEDE